MIKKFGEIKEPPLISIIGNHTLSKNIIESGQKVSKELEYDETLLRLIGSVSDNINYDKWHFEKIKYSEIKALREYGYSQNILTGNILPFYYDSNFKKTFLFQKRTSNVNNPDKISFFGGCASDKDFSIYDTVIRELSEELFGLKILKKHLMNSYCCLSEDDYGNVQFNFINVEIKKIKKLEPNHNEGELIEVKQNDLFQYIKDNKDEFTKFSLYALESFFKREF